MNFLQKSDWEIRGQVWMKFMAVKIAMRRIEFKITLGVSLKILLYEPKIEITPFSHSLARHTLQQTTVILAGASALM